MSIRLVVPNTALRGTGLLLAVALGLAGCQKTPPPSTPQERWPVPPVPALAAPKVPLPQPATAVQVPAGAAQPNAALCEVELSGEFTETVPAGQVLAVYVAHNDCLAPDAHTLSRTLVAETGKFFNEVFVPCGWQLSVCAARELRDLEHPAPKPTTYYGKLPRDLVAQGQGEIEFDHLSWPLAVGPEKLFAAPRPIDAPH